MLTTLRYTLAAVCFAASVGCLALWALSMTTRVGLNGFDRPKSETRFAISSRSADLIITAVSPGVGTVRGSWYSITTASRKKPSWAVEDRFQGLPHYVDYHGVTLILFPYWFLIAITFVMGFLIWPRTRIQVSIRTAFLFITAVVVMIAMDTTSRR